MENKPLISVIMPTLNSDKTIRMALESIRNQDFNQDLIEILVVDGGSSDNTLNIAKEFGCKIIPNPKVQPEFAKYEGIMQAEGKYAVFLDSDEILRNNNAMKDRIDIFVKENVKFILTGGYIRPENSNSINDYINNFSDPFSFFMYGTSSDYRYYFNIMTKRYSSIIFDKYAILNLNDKDIIPLSDLCAGNSIDLDYAKNEFIQNSQNVNIIIELISLIIKKEKRFAMLRNDFIVHYSSDSFKKYLNKIKWRIINNIFYRDAAAGFSNKQGFNSLWFRVKKYLFIPYSLSFIFPFIVGLYFAIIKNSFVLILHGFFTFYTGFLIVYYYILKILKLTPKLKAYGK